jgi:large subunit ribosomal protein L17
MRHKSGYRHLNRTASHRKALFRNLATSLLRSEKVETTVEKAKELRPIVEKLITLGRRSDIHAKRKAYSYVEDKAVVHKLFHDISPRYVSRPGGYLRITRIGNRPGDNAEKAIIEFV